VAQRQRGLGNGASGGDRPAIQPLVSGSVVGAAAPALSTSWLASALVNAP
jgi:hypothetical protein